MSELWGRGIWGVEPPVGRQKDLAPVEEIPECNARDIVTQIATCAKQLDEFGWSVSTAVFSDSVANRRFSIDQSVVACYCHVVKLLSLAPATEALSEPKNTS
jgi:hypothetical protein